MQAYIWKDTFNTGANEIDRQHKQFLNYLNECSDYVFSCNKERVVPELISKLKDYATMHFTYEEELMQTISYERYNHHKKQHGYFNDQLAELENAISNGVNEKAVSLAVFMRDWLISHILEEDKLYVPHLAHKNR